MPVLIKKPENTIPKENKHLDENINIVENMPMNKNIEENLNTGPKLEKPIEMIEESKSVISKAEDEKTNVPPPVYHVNPKYQLEAIVKEKETLPFHFLLKLEKLYLQSFNEQITVLTSYFLVSKYLSKKGQYRNMHQW